MARYAFSSILTEVTRRLGNHDATGFDARVKNWIEQAYLRLCQQYHHYELDAVDTSKTITSGNSTVALPSGVYQLIAVDLTSASAYVRKLKPVDFRSIRARFSTANDTLYEYARFADTLYFKNPADATYGFNIYYYKDPTAPNFSSGNSALDEGWDEAIMELAVHLGASAIGRPDWAQSSLERLMMFLAVSPNPPLKDYLLSDRATVSRVDTSHGGAQG